MPFNEILIRFGHEMNGNWYGWSGDPAAFVAAWRHVVSVFRTAGVTNVKWIWSANVDNGSYPFRAYFPGDEWVDYTGLDGYNWGTAGVGVNRWESLAQVFSSSYAQLTQLSTKPVIITEVSASEVGGDKAAWIREGFLQTIPQRLTRVNAVVWFDRDQEENWRIDSSPSSLAAYREVVSSSIYGGPNPAPAAGAGSLAVESVAVTAPASETGAGGAVASYELSRKAQLEISVQSPGGGRKAYRTVVRRSAKQGRVRLSRLVHGRKLRAGTYRVTATAVDASGTRSKPRRTSFKVRHR
jgi:hypothetical protein